MTATSAEANTRITYRPVLVPAALALLPGLAYLAGVLVPYYASGLDTLSLADLAAGAQPPSDPGPVGAGWLSLLGFYSVLLTPLGALLALGGCTLQLLAAFPRSERRVSRAWRRAWASSRWSAWSPWRSSCPHSGR